MKLSQSHKQILSGGLLIAATTIGVGMLALPVATGPGGFFPSIIIYFLCWAFMLCTGLLMLEVISWMPPDANLITMATRILGRPGKLICWFVYLFLFETMMVAHLVAGGAITSEIFSGSLGVIGSTILYTIIFSPIVYLGTKMVDRLNYLMFSGVLVSYFLFLFVSLRHVDVSLLTYHNWKATWIALPILFTAFTYQIILPTIVTYMNKDYAKVRKSIFLGTSVPLAVYTIWQFLILGIIPIEGANGLISAKVAGETAVAPLKYFVGSASVIGIGKAFAFFAMTASYIALALAFVDFLADGLGMKKVGLRKLFLCLIVFVPPLFISMYNPDAFLKALGYAGGVSCAILFGVYPPLMVWVGRYKMGHTTGRQIRGERIFLSILMLFIVFELVMQFFPKAFDV